MRSRISSKGQITVPVAVRDALGLLPGTPVEFVLRDGGDVVMRKGQRGTDPVDRVYGKLRLERSVDELIDELRGPVRPPPTPPRRRRKTR